MLLLNAFSINMLSELPASVNIQTISQGTAIELLNDKCESAVGHKETAAILTEMLGLPVAYNRTNVSLKRGSDAIVAQYIGPRLPEGSTTLPENARIDFFYVEITEAH